jgi:glycerol uptake facilitator protein
MGRGTDAGYAINPARDFGPRLASFFTGYGGAWRDQCGNFYFWVPIIGPLIGGPVRSVPVQVPHQPVPADRGAGALGRVPTPEG